MTKAIKIAGSGMTKFGELWEFSLEDLMLQAAREAIEDSGVDIDDIDIVFVANMLGGEISGRSNLGAILNTNLGISKPALRVEAACASGGMAIFQAAQYLRAGGGGKALVVGVEKMTDNVRDGVSHLLMQAGSEDEISSGVSFAGLHAFLAKAYMQKFHLGREHLALMSVLAHHNAINNGLAHFRKKIQVQDVFESPVVAAPLSVLDCSPISDGAAAVLLSMDDTLSLGDDDILLVDSACSTDIVSFSQRSDNVGFCSTQRAAKQIYTHGALKAADIDIFEIHDCFSIAGLIALEDLALAEPGKAWKLLDRILQRDSADVPIVNTYGGLKAIGHPVGATGVRQIVDIRRKLCERSSISTGLAHNIGGVGTTCVLNLLARANFVKKMR